MLTSKLYAPTLREVPSDAEITSHRLMLRAGMIRKAAGGVYTYLPLAWRTIKKIEQIIREEMDAAGGQELCMPIMQPAEIWQESGRWSVFGQEMFRLKDCHGREFCLGPTHEEMITTLVRDEVRSYKQLPLLLYQIQNKYRDEIRPRFGLMRSREFIMKDLYSFDKDEAGADVSYKKMYDAYTNIFTRCGLKFRPVEADAGAIGGNHTHEFTVLAAAGESEIACCTACDYAANVEKAELLPIDASEEEAQPLKKVETPACKTIELVADFLRVPLEKTIKAVAFQDENDALVLAFVRGDHEVNDVKLQNAVGALELRMADEAAISAAGGVAGFMSPIGIKKGTKIVVDSTVMKMKNAVAGANEVDVHYMGVNPVRDFTDVVVADIRMPPSHTDEGLRATTRIRAQWPEAPILLLSQYVVAGYLPELLADGGGALGYLLKDRVGDIDAFLGAVERVARGELVLDPDVVSQVLQRGRRDDPLTELTPREREVLALMAEGHTNAGIAKIMVVTEGAVEKHTQRIFAKLGLLPDAAVHRRVKAVLTLLSA